MIQSSDEHGVINLRGGEEAEFRINHLGNNDSGNGFANALLQEEAEKLSPSTQIRISFGKFVNLIASNDYESIFESHQNADVIVGADLLADLASAKPEVEENGKKLPYIFAFGIVLGVIVTWILLKT